MDRRTSIQSSVVAVAFLLTGCLDNTDGNRDPGERTSSEARATTTGAFDDLTIGYLPEECPYNDMPAYHDTDFKYTRVIDSEDNGEYTVNFYVEEEMTIRAAEGGRVDLGPNPMKTGRIQTCEPEIHP